MRRLIPFCLLVIGISLLMGCGGGGGHTPRTNRPVTRVYSDDPAIFFSPYNWVQTGTGASSAAFTPNTGAYIKFKVSVAPGSRVSVTLLCDPSIMDGLGLSPDNYPLLKVFVDNRVTKNAVRLAEGVTAYEIARDLSPGTHEILVAFRSVTTALPPNRWDDGAPLYAWKVTGITFSEGVHVSTPTLRPNRLLAYGSSSFEGAEAVSAGTAASNMDATLAFAWKLAEADKLNAEVGIVGWSGQGYVTKALGSVPSFYTGRTWTHITRNHARSFAPAPDYILLRLGKNDAGDYSSSLYDRTGRGWLTDIRAACPDATLFITSPYYNGEGTPTQSGYTTTPVQRYKAEHPGSRLTFLDLSSIVVTMNGRHPSSAGHTTLTNRLWELIRPSLADTSLSETQ